MRCFPCSSLDFCPQINLGDSRGCQSNNKAKHYFLSARSFDAADDGHREQRQRNIGRRCDHRVSVAHCEDLSLGNTLLALEAVEGELGYGPEVAALEYGEEKVGSAHDRGDGKDAIYHMSLPLPSEDPEEEDGQRYFNGDHGYEIEAFANENPLRLSDMCYNSSGRLTCKER
jgi:hypothetical protein